MSVTLEPINEFPPIFNVIAIPAATVDEGTPPGPIYTVGATDADEFPHDVISYSLSGKITWVYGVWNKGFTCVRYTHTYVRNNTHVR